MDSRMHQWNNVIFDDFLWIIRLLEEEEEETSPGVP